MLTSREEAFRVITLERNYQDLLTPSRVEPSERPHSVGEELVMLDTYIRKAKDAYTGKPGNIAALHEIRKIAALAVRCMENHGSLERV